MPEAAEHLRRMTANASMTMFSPPTTPVVGAVANWSASFARAPLLCLERYGHPIGEQRIADLRQHLSPSDGGGGLRLFFPEHELGFRYSKNDGAANQTQNDVLLEGRRAPHCRLRFKLQNGKGYIASVSDLSAQLHEVGATPGAGLYCYVIIVRVSVPVIGALILLIEQIVPSRHCSRCVLCPSSLSLLLCLQNYLPNRIQYKLRHLIYLRKIYMMNGNPFLRRLNVLVRFY